MAVWYMLQDIDSWETALKHAAGSPQKLGACSGALEAAARGERGQSSAGACNSPCALDPSCTPLACISGCLRRKLLTAASKLYLLCHGLLTSPVCVVAEECICQMSVVTSQLKDVTAALSSREASIGRLKNSQARLSSQVTEQRDYIQELQAKLMAALREVGRCTMME